MCCWTASAHQHVLIRDDQLPAAFLHSPCSSLQMLLLEHKLCSSVCVTVWPPAWRAWLLDRDQASVSGKLCPLKQYGTGESAAPNCSDLHALHACATCKICAKYTSNENTTQGVELAILPCCRRLLFLRILHFIFSQRRDANNIPIKVFLLLFRNTKSISTTTPCTESAYLDFQRLHTFTGPSCRR